MTCTAVQAFFVNMVILCALSLDIADSITMLMVVKEEEFIVNWFHLDEYGWKVNFSD